MIIKLKYCEQENDMVEKILKTINGSRAKITTKQTGKCTIKYITIKPVVKNRK